MTSDQELSAPADWRLAVYGYGRDQAALLATVARNYARLTEILGA